MKKKDQQFYLVDLKILPEAIKKTIRVKEMLQDGTCGSINEAVKKVDISRSAYYKYKDHVFNVSEGMIGNKATVSFLLNHEPGVLSSILRILAENKANVLTISQDIPINKIANLSITFDMSSMELEMDAFLTILKRISGVVRAELIAME